MCRYGAEIDNCFQSIFRGEDERGKSFSRTIGTSNIYLECFPIRRFIRRLRIMIDNIGDRFASFAAAWRVVSIFLGKGSMELRAIHEAPALANEWAVARPMPPEAPVMRTAWSV